MKPIQTAYCTTLLALLCACTQQNLKPVAAASDPSAKPDENAVNALYVRLDAASARYLESRALARDGNDAGAAAEARAAEDDLQAAATQCAATPGCETQRFFAAFDHLLRFDSGMLEDAGDPVSELQETPEASGEAGESSAIVAALPEAGRSITLLKGRELSEIIALNDPVKVALEQWLTQYRPNLMQAYENYQYLRHRMWPEYQKAGLPEAVLFGILAKESGGKVHAVSRSGASGPLQFMYATGLRFGLGTLNGFDLRFDAALSARANAAYLNEQLKIFNNNLELVLGAYNGGEGYMQRVAARRPDPSFWDPKIYYEISPETRDYVPMVLAAAWLFLHPERYHLELPKLDGKPGSFTLRVPASLTELTVCLGQDGNPNGWFRTLRNLNPAWEPQQRLPEGTRIDVPAALVSAYAKYCTSGPWLAVANDLHSAAALSTPGRSPARSYVVRKGDTLGGIAHRFSCVSTGELASLNRLKPPQYALRIGQNLQVPGCAKN